MFTTSTDSETTELVVNSLHPFYTYTFVIVPVTVDVGTNHSRITIRTEEAGIAIAIVTYLAMRWNPPYMNTLGPNNVS